MAVTRLCSVCGHDNGPWSRGKCKHVAPFNKSNSSDEPKLATRLQPRPKFAYKDKSNKSAK